MVVGWIFQRGPIRLLALFPFANVPERHR